VTRWIVWLSQDYNITHDRPALQVIQANKTQIGKHIKHKLLKSLKLLDYKNTEQNNEIISLKNTPAFLFSALVPFCHTLGTVHTDSAAVGEVDQLHHVTASQSHYQ